VRGRSEIALEQENEKGHHEPNPKLFKKAFKEIEIVRETS
jgi:hypothetical protein